MKQLLLEIVERLATGFLLGVGALGAWQLVTGLQHALG